MGPATCCSDVAPGGRGHREALAASLHGGSEPSPGVDGLRLCARSFLFSMHVGCKICKSKGLMSLHLMVNTHTEAPRRRACSDTLDISFPQLYEEPPSAPPCGHSADSCCCLCSCREETHQWQALLGASLRGNQHHTFKGSNCTLLSKSETLCSLTPCVCTPTTQREAVIYCHWRRNSKFSRVTLCTRYVQEGFLVWCTKEHLPDFCRTGNLVGSKEIFGPCRCKELMDAVFCLWMIFTAHISSERANKQDRIM